MLWEHEVAGSNPVAPTSDYDFVVLLSSNAMDDTALLTCPYCFEAVEVYIDARLLGVDDRSGNRDLSAGMVVGALWRAHAEQPLKRHDSVEFVQNLPLLAQVSRSSIDSALLQCSTTRPFSRRQMLKTATASSSRIDFE
jgi:hypothetical protein